MLTINPKKSKAMMYHSNNQRNMLADRNIILNGTKLEIVARFVYFGIRLDSQLSFNEHVEHLYHSARNMVFTLNHIRSCMDRNTAIIIFKSHILSRLE